MASSSFKIKTIVFECVSQTEDGLQRPMLQLNCGRTTIFRERHYIKSDKKGHYKRLLVYQLFNRILYRSCAAELDVDMRYR